MIKGATIKITRRQALENMRQPIPNETQGDPDIHKKWTELWYKDSLVNQINKLEFEDTSFFSKYGLELEEPSYSDTKQGFNEAKEEIIKLIWKE